MTTDDDPENDPMIKSMRSVWLGMREEDPPQRGLAELMAAARTQAEAMKPEPWWRRSFAFLVRPPVMAAAAVVVLIGGTLAIKGRTSEDAAMPAIEMRAKEQPAQDTIATRDFEVEHAKLEKTDSKAPEAAPVTTPADPVKPGPKVMKPPPAKPVVPSPQQGEDSFGYGNVQVDSGKTGAGSAAPPPPPPPPPQDPGGGLLIAGESKDIKAPVTKPADNRPEPTSKPKVVDDELGGAEPTSIKQNGRVDNTEQLVKQAETAATRKDCPAVRATAARIKKSAPETYKSRVVTQPAIARCLK